MRIVVLGTRGFPNVQGGVESHCEHIYPYVVQQGHEVIALTRAPYVDTSLDMFKGINLIRVSCPKNKFLEAIIHTFKGVLLAKKLNCDIFHIHAIGPSLFVPLARMLGLKVVITHHGPDYERKKWNRFAKWILMTGEMLGTRCANAVISISKHIADSIQKKHNRKDINIIPNGVEIPELSTSQDALNKYGVEKGKYILTIGRFVPEKGFHDLIDAFASFQENSESYQNVKLVIIGDADHEDEYSRGLKQKAAESKNVVLTGFLKGRPLSELYSQAGLFVLPSYYEGLPISLLEAMSYGLSCIVSDIPANRNVDLPEDRFFPPDDIPLLSEKLSRYISAPLTETQRDYQIQMIAENYNWKKIASDTVDVYKSIVR